MTNSLRITLFDVQVFGQACRDRKRAWVHIAVKVIWWRLGELRGSRCRLGSRWVLGVLLFIGALLWWLPVFANRRIMVVFGGVLVCSVVAGGGLRVAGF